MLTCRACGSQSPDDARDCENCVQPLARPAAVREQASPPVPRDPRSVELATGDPFAGAASPNLPDSVCLSAMDSVVVANPAEGEVVTLGRDVDLNGMVWTDNVSRIHASVTRSAGVLEIRDCGSSNGTFVNGVRLHSEEAIGLTIGDIVEFAQNPPTRLIASPGQGSQSHDRKLPDGE